MTVYVPAICERCGHAFPSGVVLGDRVSVVMVGNKSGPCPNCKTGWGSIPDGLYEVADNVLRITSDWTDADRQRLADELANAHEQDDLEAAESAIRSRPDLFAAVQQLVVPKDPTAFWTLALFILEILRQLH